MVGSGAPASRLRGRPHAPGCRQRQTVRLRALHEFRHFLDHGTAPGLQRWRLVAADLLAGRRVGGFPRFQDCHRLPVQFTDLKAGPQGELYLQLQLQTGGTGSAIDTTFARYQNGNWEYFPKPEDLSGVSRRSYLPIEVDDMGNLLTFGLPNDTQPGQIYRFVSSGVVSGGVVQGLWKALPTDPSLAQEDQLRQVTVDTQGHMVTGLGDPSASNRPVQEIKQVPLRADQSAQTLDLALPVAGMNRVEAGGLGPSGALEYVPVSWY